MLGQTRQLSPRAVRTVGLDRPCGRIVRRPRRAFTLAEALAAIVFLAILVPVAIKGLRLASRAAILSVRQREAGRLARNLLAEAAVTDEWRDGNRMGDFGEDARAFAWMIEDNAWEEDTMRTLTVRVHFYVQEREHYVALTTLVPENEEDLDADVEVASR